MLNRMEIGLGVSLEMQSDSCRIVLDICRWLLPNRSQPRQLAGTSPPQKKNAAGRTARDNYRRPVLAASGESDDDRGVR